MPIGDGSRLPGTAPSTNPDGLDLGVAEARAMSQEEFSRVFGFASLDHVPLVQPGFLERAPRGCEWYVRFRPAPKNPGPKDRKEDAYELVVKAPRRGAPEAGGGIVNPLRIGLAGKDPDAARLEALVYLARKSGRRRRATNWRIERIQSLLCWDLLEKYKAAYLSEPLAGKKEDSGERNIRIAKLGRIRAFQKAFPDLEVGDVSDWIVKEYDRRAKDRAATSRSVDLYLVRWALRMALVLVGVPPTYQLHLNVPAPPRLPKVAWTPEEYDRVRAAAHGWIFSADGTPKMIPGPDGPVQARRRKSSVTLREAWRRAIEFLPYTASRHGRLTATRWLPPEAEPLDGRPLKDRPWIEVTEQEVVYHRDGEARYDGSKRRGPVIIPVEFAPTVRAWYAADLTAGREFVFHRADGSRFLGRYLHKETFGRIVQDAGLAARRVPHHFKDLAVQWSDSAGIDRHTLAVHADTTVETLEAKYGDPMNVAKLLEAAEKMTQADWGGRRADVIKLFERARGKSRPAPTRRRRAGGQ
jgi:hypothetical protein